ncbi:hypothetical protein ACB098_11G129500 [Castanea mollissima]
MASCFRPKQLKRSKSWFKDFQYNPQKDEASDVRNILLIVATLIAAVTFPSGVNPPGGVWQDDDYGHEPGRATYASRKEDYYVFLFFNSVALSSVLVIMCLTFAFPFYIEILVATASMPVTYGSSIFAVTPGNSIKFRYILMGAALPFVVRGLIYLVEYCYDCVDEEKQENLCSNCRREISGDNLCIKCGSEISKISKDVEG